MSDTPPVVASLPDDDKRLTATKRRLAALWDNRITRAYTRRLFFASALLTLSSANFAFDNQGFSQTQAMDPFVARFGDRNANGKRALPSSFLSLSNAFPLLLLVCGIVIGSTISHRYGRRMMVFCMSIWAICCVPIVTTSTSRSQFLAGRCLNSVYIGMEMSVIPVFQAEIVPPAVRGLAVASYQMSFAFGGFIISAICHRTATLTSDWAWRIPFLCYLLVPSIVAVCIWQQPESPHWLAMHGRLDEARHALVRLRSPIHDVDEDLRIIVQSIDDERARTGTTASEGYVRSHLRCFQAPNRKRTLIVIAVNFFLQATGSAFTSLYGPIIIKKIGSVNPFNYSMINNGLTACMYLINIFLNDRLGRRPLMLFSAAMQATCLFIIAGLGTIASPSLSINAALSAFIILFSLSFCVGWAPLSYLISAEIPAQSLRDQTTRIGFAVGIVTQFVVAFTVPYLVYDAGLNLRVGFIYGPLATLAFVWAYVFLPECKDLRLEQVSQLFDEGVSARHSRVWGVMIRARDVASPSPQQLHQLSDDKKV